MNSPRTATRWPLLVDAVAPGGRPVQVAGQREAQSAQPAARPRRRDPALVRLDRVATDPQQVAVLRRELVEPLGQPDQLGRADQRKVAADRRPGPASGLDNPPARPGSAPGRGSACTEDRRPEPGCRSGSTWVDDETSRKDNTVVLGRSVRADGDARERGEHPIIVRARGTGPEGQSIGHRRIRARPLMTHLRPQRIARRTTTTRKAAAGCGTTSVPAVADGIRAATCEI